MFPSPDPQAVSTVLTSDVEAEIVQKSNVSRSLQEQLDVLVGRRDIVGQTEEVEDEPEHKGRDEFKYTLRDAAGLHLFALAEHNWTVGSKLVVHRNTEMWRGVLIIGPSDAHCVKAAPAPSRADAIAELEQLQRQASTVV